MTARLVFGQDRLPEKEAQCAAWPTLTRLQGMREAAYTRFLRPHPAQIGGYETDKRDRTAEYNSFIRGARKDMHALKGGTLPGWEWHPHEHTPGARGPVGIAWMALIACATCGLVYEGKVAGSR